MSGWRGGERVEDSGAELEVVFDVEGLCREEGVVYHCWWCRCEREVCW